MFAGQVCSARAQAEEERTAAEKASKELGLEVAHLKQEVWPRAP